MTDGRVRQFMRRRPLSESDQLLCVGCCLILSGLAILSYVGITVISSQRAVHRTQIQLIQPAKKPAPRPPDAIWDSSGWDSLPSYWTYGMAEPPDARLDEVGQELALCMQAAGASRTCSSRRLTVRALSFRPVPYTQVLEQTREYAKQLKRRPPRPPHAPLRAPPGGAAHSAVGTDRTGWLWGWGEAAGGGKGSQGASSGGSSGSGDGAAAAGSAEELTARIAALQAQVSRLGGGAAGGNGSAGSQSQAEEVALLAQLTTLLAQRVGQLAASPPPSPPPPPPSPPPPPLKRTRAQQRANSSSTGDATDSGSSSTNSSGPSPAAPYHQQGLLQRVLRVAPLSAAQRAAPGSLARWVRVGGWLPEGLLVSGCA